MNTTTAESAGRCRQNKQAKSGKGRRSKFTKAHQNKQAKSPDRGTRKVTKLEREVFQTSRTMEFFSEKELIAQTGHSRSEWHLVVVKECIDNALDACEEADVAPEITVSCDSAGITVSDNGPGIPNSTVEGAVDFSVRCSSREAYVAPDRGAQGNALMTLIAMPFVLSGDAGRLCITSCGECREIFCRVDAVTQQPVVELARNSSIDHNGTTVAIRWPEQIETISENWTETYWPFSGDGWNVDDEQGRVQELVRGYALFNPHLSIKLKWFGETIEDLVATNASWPKWKPNRPTNPHWYEMRHLERLLGCYIAKDRQDGTDRTVSSFIAEFDGLAGTRKRKEVIEKTGMARMNLSNLADDNAFKKDLVAKLLEAMKTHTKPVKPARLGVIGKDHFLTRFREFGCAEEQTTYFKKMGEENGVPYVVESCFGWLGDGAPDSRLILPGANWSAAIHNPFRSFGKTGEGLEAHLSNQRAGRNEPIIFALHLAHPRVEYADRGKSSIIVGGNQNESS